MRIKKITLHKNRPISYDQIEIETTDGYKYYLLDCEIEELLQHREDMEGEAD